MCETERKETNPLLSVIIPVYNIEAHLEKCLESVISQTWRPLEIIVVDDGSTDRSGHIADAAAEKQACIRVIHKENGGLSAARNAGMRIAGGAYITFVDGDDHIEKEMYEVMMTAILQRHADIAVCGRTDEYDDGLAVPHRDTPVPAEEQVLSARAYMAKVLSEDGEDFAVWNKVFRRSLWTDITFPEGRIYEDMCVLPRVISRADSVLRVKGAFYHYVHHQGSITTSFSEKRIRDLEHATGAVSAAVTETGNGFSDGYSAIPADALTDGSTDGLTDTSSDALKNELSYFKNRYFLSLIAMADYIGYKGGEVRTAEAWLREHWKDAFSHRRMPAAEKMMYALHRAGLLGVVLRRKWG